MTSTAELKRKEFNDVVPVLSIGGWEETALTFAQMTAGDKSPETSPSDPTPTNLEPTRLTPLTELSGEVLNGRYVIEKEIKRGGMGVVYLALDRQLHSRPVVVKVLLDEAYQSEYVVQKFRQEVEALSRIDHPGIVGIIDAGELHNGRPYIVMQYVEGITLRSLISQEGMNLERTADILKQVCRALGAAHGRGIFHRDLKPENIMLQNLGDGEEQVKIIDFGIAKVKDSVVAPSTSLNLSAGTVAYMAPEQLNGRPITAATDVFALGTIAYEMVTGRKPFNPETGFELLQMQQSGVRVKPVDLRPSLPLKAQQSILKALSFNASDRHQGPREFGEEFSRALAQEVTGSGVSVVEGAELPLTQLPPSPLSTEETPFAKATAEPVNKTIPVQFQPAQPINPAVGELGFTGQSSRSRKSRTGLVIGALITGVILVAIVGVAIWYVRKSRTEVIKEPTPETERLMNYGLTVQKMRSGKPYQGPFESSGQEIFENGWKFRMFLTSPQQGYLYLLNEGPEARGKITYNLLFPAPSANDGSPQVAADQKIQTPWMVFDVHQGTEKFWIVWSAKAVSEFEAVKGVVNPNDKGNISDPDQLKAVQEFLDKHSSPKPQVQKSANRKETEVKAKGEVLVHLMELEHH